MKNEYDVMHMEHGTVYSQTMAFIISFTLHPLFEVVLSFFNSVIQDIFKIKLIVGMQACKKFKYRNKEIQLLIVFRCK